jgi:hypothetical protein
VALVRQHTPPGPPGLPVRDIHARMGMWAPATVSNVLLQLVRRGDAAFTGEIGKRRYYLVSNPELS